MNMILPATLVQLLSGASHLKNIQDGQVQHRSPAMAARLTDHMWTVREWLLCPVTGGQG